MPDFNIRSDSINVEQIMEQIRARVREKRGVDYTEEQIRALASVKLEKFLDPRGVRSDLLEQYRRAQSAPPSPARPNYAFEEQTLYESHRAPIRWMRKLLNPILKLFFNPGPLIQALNIQSQLNTMHAEHDARQEAARHGVEQLYYEVLHNLVVEMTRTGIEVKNLRMQVESLAGRLEFNERRARALESAVVYRSDSGTSSVPAPQRQPDFSDTPGPAAAAGAPRAAGAQQAGQPAEGPGQRSRRRRRRRGRRGGQPASVVMAQPGQTSPPGPVDAVDEAGGFDDAADENPSSPAGDASHANDDTPGGDDEQ